MSVDHTIEHRGGRNLLVRYLSRFEEGRVIRAAFFGMLMGTVTVLGLDLKNLIEENGGLFPPAESSTAVTVPVRPPAVDSVPSGGSSDPRQFITTDERMLREPIRFWLEADGVLRAVGSIDTGAARRFADEIADRGGYVEVVSIDSPGGSLDDAMEIGRLIRKNGFATRVPDGAICASSCPLMLAGGIERRVSERAAIGLHQVYAATRGTTAPAQAMADAQMTTARISRLLAEFGVDPAMWLHALDTPPRQLYYLSGEEMRKYRLVTNGGTLALGGS